MKITRHLLTGFALSCLVSVAGADMLRTVAFSGDSAPGIEGLFSSVIFPSLNNQGQIAFVGILTGTGVDDTNDRGIWSEGSGSLALVARAGNQAPGTDVNFSDFFLFLILNDSGQTAFYSQLTVPEVNGWSGSLWSEGNGSLALVARSGNEAPGTNASFGYFDRHVFSNDGKTAFLGTSLEGGISQSGIWSGKASSVDLVAQEGETVPGSNLRLSGIGNPVLNGKGQTAFTSNGRSGYGIWLVRDGSLTLVARSQDMAPGTTATFSKFQTFKRNLALNDLGHTAFLARLGGTGVDISNDDGIWSEGSGSLTLVALEGNEAPGTNANFSRFDNLVLNGAGQTAFVGGLTGNGVDGNNDFGIWSEGNGPLSLVAREGGDAPGTSQRFANVGRTFVLNRAGQVAFSGELTGLGVDDSNDTGIWAQSPSGVLTLIAREGEQLDVDDGPAIDRRTVGSLSFGPIIFSPASTGNEDGRASGFNDRGQLAFQATFTDGTSGIFVSNLVAIPEPTSAMLIFTALAMGGVRRRRIS